MPFDSVQLSDVARLLIEGRKLIDECWGQGSRTEPVPQGKLCAITALYSLCTFEMCVTESSTPNLAKNALADAAGVFGPIGLVHWNDDPARTKEEVLAIYDLAIERELSRNV